MKQFIKIGIPILLILITGVCLLNYYFTGKSGNKASKPTSENETNNNTDSRKSSAPHIYVLREEEKQPEKETIQEIEEEEEWNDPDEEKIDWGLDDILAEWNYQPEIKLSRLDFLWDNPRNDPDSIEAALRFAPQVSFEAIFYPLVFSTDFESNTNLRGVKGREAYITIMKYLYDYRTKVDLPSITEAYISLLPVFIPRWKYEKMLLGRTIRQLLFTYNDILDGTNDFSRFDTIYRIMLENEEMEIPDEDWEEKRERYYHAIAEVTNAASHTEKFAYWPEDINHVRIVWAYSFWGRRYVEGNDQDLYYILKRIHQTYEENN